MRTMLSAVLLVTSGFFVWAQDKSATAVAQPSVTVSVAGQEPKPDYGDISDLNGRTKMYLAVQETAYRKLVLKELEKTFSLEVVPSADQAQFFVDIRITSQFMTGVSLIPQADVWEMTVSTVGPNGRTRIAWSETKTSLRPSPVLLMRDFVKALKKSQR